MGSEIEMEDMVRDVVFAALAGRSDPICIALGLHVVKSFHVYDNSNV